MAALPVEDPVPPRVVFVPQAPGVEYFAYEGTTGLTAFGAVTGRRYRFSGPGAIVAIDERDAPSMAGVPKLRRTRKRAGGITASL